MAKNEDLLPIGQMAEGGTQWNKNPTIWIPEIPDSYQVNRTELEKGIYLEKSAHDNGALNRPATDDVELDKPQAEIRHRVEKGIALLNEFLAEQLSAANQKMLNASEPITENQIEKILSEARQYFEQATIGNSDLRNKKQNELRAERDLKHFRARHKITRSAVYKESPFLFGSILLLCVVIESIANGGILQEISRGGFVGGVFLASVISLVNLCLGIASGLVGWRLVGHRFNAQKVIGWTVTILTVIAAFFWNLSVAHYRDAAEIAAQSAALNQTDLAQTVSSGWEHWQSYGMFGLGTIFSWALFGLGLLVFFFVSMESWKDAADQYWDYKKWDKRYEDAKTQYEFDFDLFAHEIKAGLNEFNNRLDSLNQYAKSEIKIAKKSLGLANQRFEEVRNSETKWVNEGKVWLKFYRDENEKVRNSPVPKYWTIFENAADFRACLAANGNRMTDEGYIPDLIKKLQLAEPPLNETEKLNDVKIKEAKQTIENLISTIDVKFTELDNTIATTSKQKLDEHFEDARSNGET